MHFVKKPWLRKKKLLKKKVCLKIIPFFAFTPHTGKLENKFPARMSVMEAKTVALSIFKAH